MSLHDRFLLKYASRDEVELHSRGTTGVVEMRKAIAQYEEASPLYGFLKYRRRNLIIKYQPEGCSRLVQGKNPSCSGAVAVYLLHTTLTQRMLPSLHLSASTCVFEATTKLIMHDSSPL